MMDDIKSGTMNHAYEIKWPYHEHGKLLSRYINPNILTRFIYHTFSNSYSHLIFNNKFLIF